MNDEDDKKPAEPSQTPEFPVPDQEEPADTTPAAEEPSQETGELPTQPYEVQTPEPIILSTEKQSRLNRFSGWYKAHKKLSIPLTILALLTLLFVIPMTRYAAAGLVMKKHFTITVLDSKTGDGISEALVSFGDFEAKTNGRGVAQLRDVPVGQYTATVTKKYYKDAQSKFTIGLAGEGKNFNVDLEAIGRPVNVKVKNAISTKSLEGAGLKAGEIESKTDDKGEATLIIPTGTNSIEAEVSFKGYNTKKVKLEASDKETKTVEIGLVPEGKIYFLSKRSGKIDVVKANLDGSDRKTVLAGTGKEDEGDTSLLAATDWKYLALKSKRDGGENPKIFLLDTATDKLTIIDEGNATFNLVGWSNHHFVFELERNNKGFADDKRQVLKVFDADSKTLKTLYENASFSGPNDYEGRAYENININELFLVGGELFFTKEVYLENYWSETANGKKGGLYKANLASGAVQAIREFKYLARPNESEIVVYQTKPGDLYFRILEGNSGFLYFEYEGSNVETDKAGKDNFDKYAYIYQTTYLQSPSGKETLWSESRDGRSVLFVGSSDGNNGEIIDQTTKYSPYGWYSDEYILISLDSSELFIASRHIKDTPSANYFKITDYHRPSYSYYGYGGGYGGL